MPIPQRKRNLLALPDPPEFKEVDVDVRCVDVMFVGGIPRSFDLAEDDTIEWGSNVLLLTIKGAEISIFLSNVLSIDEYKATRKKRVKLDPIADFKKANPVGGVQ